MSANGRVSVRRRRWHSPESGGDAPIDRLLDGAEATLSVGVRELCCLLNRDAASFKRAAHNLLRTTDVRISAELLRQVVESEGRQVLACSDDGRLDPQWGPQQCRTTATSTTAPLQGQGPSRIYLGCDGFTAQLITDAEKLKRRSGVKLNSPW